MQRTIDHIETAGPDRRARRLVFGDDLGERLTSAAVVKSLGIVAGEPVDLEALTAAEADAARERALNFLGYRERSARELAERLLNDGYPESLSHSIVDRFVELGLVDDERFARMWARSRASAGYGPRRISHELVLKGVTEPLVRAAVEDAVPSPVEAAAAALRGKTACSRSQREKLVRKLVQRGFDVSTAVEAVRGDREAGHDDDVPFIAE